MTQPHATRPARKRPDRYHHGDLRRALLQAAVRVIQSRGTEALTLRGVGETLGVSRSALYRHFTDKAALLAAVGQEGFGELRARLQEAWEQHGRGRAGFEAMGMAYVRFALSNPSHYRVMFGSTRLGDLRDPELVEEASGAFQALVDALVVLQRDRLVRREDPLQVARFVWAIVHGIAMLAIDGQLERQRADAEMLTRYAVERLRTGIAPAPDA
jgi:AcrR family transcriptional regulator